MIYYQVKLVQWRVHEEQAPAARFTYDPIASGPFDHRRNVDSTGDWRVATVL